MSESEKSLSNNSNGAVVESDECPLAFPKSMMGLTKLMRIDLLVATLEERYEVWFLLPSGTYSGKFYLVFHSLFSCFEDTLVPGHE